MFFDGFRRFVEENKKEIIDKIIKEEESHIAKLVNLKNKL